MTDIPAGDPTTRLILRHLLATLAYRAGKAVRDTPDDFGSFRQTPDSRTPAEILAHMGDLMEWVLRMVRGAPSWTTADPLPWHREVERFFGALAAVDEELASGAPILWEPGRVIQGGIADALTHTGQLAMLRRVGLRQSPADPRYEFD